MEVYYLFLFALVGLSREQYPNEPKKSPVLGLECEPPYGYQRKICGKQTTLNRTSIPVPEFLYGPNVCRFTEEFVTNELVYKYKNYCNYVAYGYYYWQYYYRCTPFCMPTSTCSDQNRTLVRHTIECCEGFTTRPLTKEYGLQYDYLYNQYYTRPKGLPEGCPVAKASDIEGCLELHGLTTFLGLYEASNIAGMLVFNESAFTFFVPTEEVLSAVEDIPDVNMLVGNHIVRGSVQVSNLTFNRRFMTLSGLMIHSTAVVFADRTLVRYSQGYSQYSQYSYQDPVKYTNVRFINGAQVVNPDACTAANVTLHIIDQVLMPENNTIAAILRSRADLSRFTEALDFAHILGFLDQNDVSRTVFVPTNDAFDEQIPPDLFMCLMYMRKPLQDIALFHIAQSAEYTSSLRISNGVHTLLPGTALIISTDMDGSVMILTDPQATIIEPNITASNGVIQVIDKVLIPTKFDARSCSDLVPTTDPPTTDPPTTDPPTTDPAQTTLNVTISPDTVQASTPSFSPVATPISSLGDVENNP